MVQFRPQAKEIIAKVVYYGPPLGGKTTNLRTLYRGYPANTRGELVVVPTGTDRTIFFDFLPVSVGTLRGMNLRVQLYTVPGQVHFNTTRQVVLRGVDGVVFVADSQKEMLAANLTSYANLKENLLLQGLALADMPHVVQYNKRDLKDILGVEELNEAINGANAPFFEAVAPVGIGVEETLQGVVRLVARSLRERFRLPFDAASAHDGLFTHVPGEKASIDRPFETAKIDTPSVYVAAPATGGEETRPLKVVAAAPEPREADRVVPFASARLPESLAEVESPAVASAVVEGAGAVLDEAFEVPLPAAVEFGGARPAAKDTAAAVFVPVAPPLEPFGAASEGGLGAPAASLPAGEAGEAAVFAVESGFVTQAPLVAAEAPPAPPGGEEPRAEAVFAAALTASAVAAAGEPFGSSQAGPGEDVFAAAEVPAESALPAAPSLLVDPYADPFADEVASPLPCVADVFRIGAEIEPEVDAATAGAPAWKEEERIPDGDLVCEPLAPMAVQVEVEEGRAPGERLLPLQEAAVQRVLPRALAQFGEVRELELEVPVPSAWVGGRRMTLQLRLTLVPEEDSHVG